jgi:hypothetical protein
LRDAVHYDSTTETVIVGYKQNLTFKSESFAFRCGMKNMTLFQTKRSIWLDNDSYTLETNTSMDINIKWGIKISTDDDFLYISKPGEAYNSTKRVKIA